MHQATALADQPPRGRLVDLSHPLWPGQERYTLEIAHRRERTSPTTEMQAVIDRSVSPGRPRSGSHRAPGQNGAAGVD